MHPRSFWLHSRTPMWVSSSSLSPFLWLFVNLELIPTQIHEMGLCSVATRRNVFSCFTVVWFSSAVSAAGKTWYFFLQKGDSWDFSLHLFRIEIKTEIMWILQWTHMLERQMYLHAEVCVQVLTHPRSSTPPSAVLVCLRQQSFQIKSATQ